MPYLQIITTLPAPDEAKRLANVLVHARLAACVQILGPITSVYHWQGEVETGQEWQLCIKSRQDLYPDVERLIRENHPYEVPEILAVPIVAGSEAYLAWMEEELRKTAGTDP
jgi:periplasmic divalent cation tolerance protein